MKKSMEKAIVKLLIALVLCASSAYILAEEKQDELVILNWSEYLAPEIIQAFEKQYSVKIKEVYFESDDARDRILVQTQGKGFDLILVNGVVIGIYKKRGWLQPVPLDLIENSKYLEQRWLNAFEAAIGYSVPYFWGTLGVAYRKDLVSEPIASWKQFFSPSDTLKGKIVLVKSSPDIIGMALKALGYSANSIDRKELLEAKELLLNLKPYIQKFGYINLDENSALVTGDIIATMAYGGDALNVAEHNDQIVYVLPEEGGNIWVDYFTISSYSSNKEMALKFLNFINDPKWAAINAEEMYLASPNTEAQKLLSREILDDEVIYPDEQSLKNSEFFKPMPARAQKIRTTIFNQITE